MRFHCHASVKPAAQISSNGDRSNHRFPNPNAFNINLGQLLACTNDNKFCLIIIYINPLLLGRFYIFTSFIRDRDVIRYI